MNALVGYPSGQRGQTVNLLAYAFAGSNPAPTTTPLRQTFPEPANVQRPTFNVERLKLDVERSGTSPWGIRSLRSPRCAPPSAHHQPELSPMCWGETVTHVVRSFRVSPCRVCSWSRSAIAEPPQKQIVPAQPCGQTGTKWGMGVRHALFPNADIRRRFGCRLPDAILHGQRSSFGLVAGPSSGSRALDFE